MPQAMLVSGAAGLNGVIAQSLVMEAHRPGSGLVWEEWTALEATLRGGTAMKSTAHNVSRISCMGPA